MTILLISIIGIVVIVLFLVVITKIIRSHIKKKIWEETHILPKSGAFKLAPYCKHPKEYLCIKCGECGRKFIK